MDQRGLVIRGLTAVAAALALAAVAAAGTKPAPSRAALDHVPGELVVRFKPSIAKERRAEALSATGFQRKRSLRLPGAELVRVPSGQTVAAAARQLEARPEVLFAEPNSIYRATGMPDDPRFPALWGLHQASDHDIDAPEAWDEQTGSASVKVAVVDTGVAYDHPDLAANMVPGYDFFDDDADPRDEDGHGTHVAGTIGALGDNATGVTGVNWDVSLLPVRVLGPDGSGTVETVTNGFLYAAAQGAKVVNASLGGSGESQAMKDAIDAAAGTTLFVVAAGNDESDNEDFPTFPCSYASPNLVCVAATDENDSLAWFSNYGETSVDLAAPGTGIQSAWPSYTTVYSEDFESDLGGRWAGGGQPNTWARTSAKSAGGGWSATDSPSGPYPNLADNWLRMTAPLDLSGRKGCHAAYAMSISIEENYDLVSLEFSTDGSTWEGADWHHVNTAGVGFAEMESELHELTGEPTGYLRFRLESDASVGDDGVYVDDVRVRCLGGPYTADDYRQLSGTSMATPHVAGVAALVWAESSAASVAAARSALLTTVDRLPDLAGRVATGGRLNADRAVRSVATSPPPPPPAEPPPPPAEPPPAEPPPPPAEPPPAEPPPPPAEPLPPPPPAPSAPPPPPSPPPMPPPPAKPKAPAKITVCHNGKTKKLTRAQLAALRKQIARSKKRPRPKLRIGACKQPRKRR